MQQTDDVAIRPYRAEDKSVFRQLNLRWIEEYFQLEEHDRAMLDDMDGAIFGKGGRILMAELRGKPVGCVALIPIDGVTIELAKMAVDETVRKCGVGRRIVLAAIEEARAMGARRIWLESNTVLAPAIRLYEKTGFRALPPHDHRPTPYGRCNIQMIRDL